jgi:hypothetical protein
MIRNGFAFGLFTSIKTGLSVALLFPYVVRTVCSGSPTNASGQHLTYTVIGIPLQCLHRTSTLFGQRILIV